MSLEVINLGLPKSGTTTLRRALSEAGYHVADHRIKALENSDDPSDRAQWFQVICWFCPLIGSIL